MNQPADTIGASSGFTARIARSFLLLALLTVSMVGIVAYSRGRHALENAAYSRLQMTATLKQKEITRWLESCEEDFLLIADFPTVEDDIQLLLSEPESATAYQEAYQRLSAYFSEIQETKPKFAEISIQNRANQIILSTNPEKEGTYEMAANLTELESVIAGEKFAPNFYRSPSGIPAITYARKIFNSAGDRRQGMLLANLNLERIDDIISERTGLDKTGETYLVGIISNRPAFLSRSNSVLPSSEGPTSQGIEAALEGENGQAEYNNYAGDPVIGVYRWLPGQDIALLAEMGQAEAFAPARRLAVAIVLVGLGSVGVLLLGISRLARQLSESRRKIEQYSQQLEETAAIANTANQAKSEFLANMSHELRTPLNAILGFAQLMQRESDRYSTRGKQQSKQLGIISRSGEHLLNLINDVLSMSKIEAGRATFDPVCFDFRYMLLTLEEMLRMRAEAKAIELSVEIENSVPQFIKTDEVKLRQVLVNLLGNAIKFTEKGKVSLLVTRHPSDDGQLCFTVQDTGVGVTPEELTHLFDPFFQSSKTRTTQQGTGLGLAISQRFVKMMGGEIAVESQLNKGSAFSFSIHIQPANPDELPTKPLGEVVGLAPEQPAYRILVAEDVSASRELLVTLLSNVGFEVKATQNGEQAIALYQSWQPHLIWMDMRMPIVDGYEATQTIREIAAKQPTTKQTPVKIIAITASAFEREKVAVLASGCDDFVRKPFETHTIFEKMAHHLGVRYRYKHESDSVEASLSADVSATDVSDTIAMMSVDWLRQFHQAAIAVDAEVLHTLIEQIPQEHHQLANRLTDLTQNFCFDELIALTQTYA
ncbi:MAG: ATP-binding protein [Cyanobacteria bacterium J06632_3]